MSLPQKVAAAFRAAGQEVPSAEAVMRAGYSAKQSQIIEAHYRKHGATASEFA